MGTEREAVLAEGFVKSGIPYVQANVTVTRQMPGQYVERPILLV
jgi:hypothetical protein